HRHHGSGIDDAHWSANVIRPLSATTAQATIVRIGNVERQPGLHRRDSGDPPITEYAVRKTATLIAEGELVEIGQHVPMTHVEVRITAIGTGAVRTRGHFAAGGPFDGGGVIDRVSPGVGVPELEAVRKALHHADLETVEVGIRI